MPNKKMLFMKQIVMKRRRLLVLLSLLVVFLYSCGEREEYMPPDKEVKPSDNEIRTKSMGTGELTLDFPEYDVLMGTEFSPIIEFSGHALINYSQFTEATIYLFCRVGADPDVSFNSSGQLVLHNKTFWTNNFPMTKNSSGGYYIENHYEYFCVPGMWRYQAMIYINGMTIESNIVEIEVRFPNVSEIEDDIFIHMKMEESWLTTLFDADSSGRRENGFWIYAWVNYGMVEYKKGTIEYGDWITECAGTETSMTPSSPEDEKPTYPYDYGIKYYVAYFHTRTPRTYCTTGRESGPLSSDIDYAANNKIPVLVYDYGGYVEGGPDLYDYYGLYSYDCNVFCRQTPDIWLGN
jgi:hypothetical protein